MIDNSEKYLWIPVLKALAQWLIDYKEKQQELIAILTEIGVNEELEQSQEIDPFTFLVYFMNPDVDKRSKTLQELVKTIGLDIPTQFVFFRRDITYATKMDGKSVQETISIALIPKLWTLFEQALSDEEIQKEAFQNVLDIEHIGIALLTQALFLTNPDDYIPVDKQTEQWFKKNGHKPKDFDSYMELIKTLKQENKPMYQIYYEVCESNDKKGDIS